MTMPDRRPLLRAIYDAAVAAAHPDAVLAPHLRPARQGRVICLAAGKGAGAMAAAAERHYLDALGLSPERLVGIATTRHGHGVPTRRIRVVEAGHPVPDEAGLRGAADTLELALKASGCSSARVVQKPRLLSDNGPSYIAEELAQWIGANGMSHVRGAPMHPQTQGKIERWHQTLKNRILLENYFLPGDLETRIEAFIDHYNHRRYHESLGNVTPADTYFGRADAIIQQRERIKRKTIEHRRLQHRKLAA